MNGFETDFRAANVFSVREERRRLNWPNDIPEPPPLASPVTPGILPAGGPRWHRVLGFVAIVIGSLSAVGVCSGAIRMAIVLQMMQTGLTTSAEIGAWQERWRPWLIADGSARSVLGAGLLTIGIGLLRRRRWSVRVTWVWSVARTAWTILQAVFTTMMMQDHMRAMSARGAGTSPAFGIGYAIGSAVFTLAWGLTPAIFLIIWFSRPAIRRQTAQWT